MNTSSQAPSPPKPSALPRPASDSGSGERSTGVLEPGTTFSERYTIERLLGRGGMAEVYLAEQSPLGRRVALKVLRTPADLSDDPEFKTRFLREAAALSDLMHPNTVTVYDFGTTDTGQLYLVMECLEGKDLCRLLQEVRKLPARRAIHITKQVCKSLREAHAKGMVHRDLKPSNIYLTPQDGNPDFVKVLDFGLVKYKNEDT